MSEETNSGGRKFNSVQLGYALAILLIALLKGGYGWIKRAGVQLLDEDGRSAMPHWLRLKRRVTQGMLLAAVTLACVPLAGCGEDAVTTSRITAWAEDAGAEIGKNTSVHFPPKPGLHIRYSADGDSVISFAIRLTPSDAQRQDMASSTDDKAEFFKISESNTDRQDWWHRYRSQEHRSAFAESLTEARFAVLVGDRVAAAVDAALRLDTVRTDSVPSSDMAKGDIGKWSQPVVHEQMSSWSRTIGDKRIDITFSQSMRGQICVPAEVIVSMAGYDAIAPDPLFTPHPLIPDGVRRDFGFTPLPVIEHLDNGGVAYRAVPVGEHPSMFDSTHYLLVDSDKTSLTAVVRVFPSLSSNSLKAGIEWYEVYDHNWTLVSDTSFGGTHTIGEWALRDGVVVMSRTMRTESANDKFFSETRIEAVLPAHSTESGVGTYSESTRFEFLNADIPPDIKLKTAPLRIEAVTSPRRVPEFAHCKP